MNNDANSQSKKNQGDSLIRSGTELSDADLDAVVAGGFTFSTDNKKQSKKKKPWKINKK